MPRGAPPPALQRAAVASASSGWSLAMSLRLFATERRTYSEGSSTRRSRTSMTGAGSATSTATRGAQGRRGRQPSEARRRTSGSGSPVQRRNQAKAPSGSRAMNGRTAHSLEKRPVMAASSGRAASGTSRPRAATRSVTGTVIQPSKPGEASAPRSTRSRSSQRSGRCRSRAPVRWRMRPLSSSAASPSTASAVKAATSMAGQARDSSPARSATSAGEYTSLSAAIAVRLRHRPVH